MSIDNLADFLTIFLTKPSFYPLFAGSQLAFPAPSVQFSVEYTRMLMNQFKKH